MQVTATLEQEMKVEFTDPEKAKAFFIDGDWKKSFYTFDDLEELASFLMLNAREKLVVGDHWREGEELKSGADIEGFPYFYRHNGQKLIAEHDDEIGQIIISGDHSPEVSYLGQV